MKRLALPTLLAVGLLANFALAAPPELIVHHGKIATVDAKFSLAEAFAVEQGKIVAIGKNDDVLKLQGPATKVIDLGGRFVTPGLIDSHVHPPGAAMHEWDHPIPEMETIADVLAYIRARADTLDDGDWIVVRQVFITRLKEQRYPTKAELDEVAPQNPVMFSTGPDASVNSLALKLSGIDKDFKPTSSGGKIERDANGEPTGILRSAGQYVKSKSKGKSASEKDRDDRMQQLFSDYNSVGLTGVIDRNAGSDNIAQYARLRAEGKLTLRVGASHSLGSSGGIDEIRKKVEAIGTHPLRQPNNQVRIIGVKMFLDGGMLTGSAYMREPWGVSRIYAIDDPRYQGIRYIEPELLAQIVAAVSEQGMQFTAHSVGDGAVHTLLDAYETVSKQRSIKELRHCLTHSNFMSKEAVEQAARLGVVCDIQPAWLWLDTRTLQAQFGYDRLRYFQPLKSLFAAGVTVGGGSDHMQKIGSLRSVNPYNPFLGMWVAITRKAKEVEQPLHPEEALTREQALQFYTTQNARLMFLESETGSLEVGKLADFVVLDRDLLTCEVDQIRDAQVVQTFLAGKSVYQRDNSQAKP